MIAAAIVLAQVLLAPPKVSPAQEPLVRELLQVTNARQRARDVLRTVLSLEGYQTPPRIPADAALDESKVEESLRRAGEVQSKMYKRLFELTLQDANLDEAAWYIYAPLYGEGWTDDELKAMIAFYRTPLGQKMIARDARFHLFEQIGASEYFGARLRAARRTVGHEELRRSNPARAVGVEIRDLAVHLEAWAVDNGDLYPGETDLVKLQTLFEGFVPQEDIPKIDPWGTPYRIEYSADRKHYRITSAGSDRKFEVYGAPWGGAKPRVVDTPGADIVYEDSVFILYPTGAVDQRP
jgi:hypothetical protein